LDSIVVALDKNVYTGRILKAEPDSKVEYTSSSSKLPSTFDGTITMRKLSKNV
jgi:hypothetical protein